MKKTWRLKKNLANKIFGYLARCDGNFGTTTLKIKFFGSKLDQNAETDSAKIWNFHFWKIGFRENEKLAPHIIEKIAKSAPQNLKLDRDLEFSIQKSILQNPKSIAPIPLESCFETFKFEISDVENP